MIENSKSSSSTGGARGGSTYIFWAPSRIGFRASPGASPEASPTCSHRVPLLPKRPGAQRPGEKSNDSLGSLPHGPWSMGHGTEGAGQPELRFSSCGAESLRPLSLVPGNAPVQFPLCHGGVLLPFPSWSPPFRFRLYRRGPAARALLNSDDLGACPRHRAYGTRTIGRPVCSH